MGFYSLVPTEGLVALGPIEFPAVSHANRKKFNSFERHERHEDSCGNKALER